LASIEALAGCGARARENEKELCVLPTLSNGNVSLLVEMAKNAGLPWDAVLSAELFHHFEPDREVYLGAADMLGCKPAEVMMVAAQHPGDLQAAQVCGLRTWVCGAATGEWCGERSGGDGERAKQDPGSEYEPGAPCELPC
jgi:FMN phosphatase YigB (HAD superfamily)